MFGIILWLSVLISITTAVMRAANIGYQKESYYASTIAAIPMVYDAWMTGSTQAIVLNVFYLAIGVMGVVRWMRKQ